MIAIPAEGFRGSLEKFLSEALGLSADAALEQANKTLKEKASGVRSLVLGIAIKDHPLYPIIKYILNDVVDHAEAIDQLETKKVALLHVRHIEEVTAIAKFLLVEKDRHQEFGWRWNNFEALHRIRNRILNLRQPLDEQMTNFVVKNIEFMKQYFSSKFDVDEKKCLEQWGKLSNWMMKIQLKDVFDKAGHKQSYISAAYDWNSQAVHLSPIGGQYLGFDVAHMEKGEIAIESAETWIHNICKQCSGIVTEPEKLWDFYFRIVMADTYRLLVRRPERFMKLAAMEGQYAGLARALLEKPFNIDKIKEAALGERPTDPYVLNLPTADAPPAAVAASVGNPQSS